MAEAENKSGWSKEELAIMKNDQVQIASGAWAHAIGKAAEGFVIGMQVMFGPRIGIGMFATYSGIALAKTVMQSGGSREDFLKVANDSWAAAVDDEKARRAEMQ